MVPAFDDTGPYIWAAYGLAIAVICALAAITLVRARAARRRLERLQSEDDEAGE